MNENTGTVELPESSRDAQDICNTVYGVCNVAQVPSSQANVYTFAGRTISSGSDALVSVAMASESKAKVTVNCDKMVIGSMLLKDLKSELVKA